MVGDLVDDVVLLSEAEIAAAMRRLFRAEGWVAEGAGATGIALPAGRHHALLGQPVAIVVSGRKVALARFRRLVDARTEARPGGERSVLCVTSGGLELHYKKKD